MTTASPTFGSKGYASFKAESLFKVVGRALVDEALRRWMNGPVGGEVDVDSGGRVVEEDGVEVTNAVKNLALGGGSSVGRDRLVGVEAGISV
jgi:hypothetical protein